MAYVIKHAVVFVQFFLAAGVRHDSPILAQNTELVIAAQQRVHDEGRSGSGRRQLFEITRQQRMAGPDMGVRTPNLSR